LICNGVTHKTENQNSFGHGSDCFRLYSAYVDVSTSPYVNLLFRSELVSDKNAEINIIRTIYWELLRMINPQTKLIDIKANFEKFPPFEKMIFGSLKAFVEVIEDAYKNRDYSQVYTAYVDYMKYVVYDLFVPARKQMIIANYFSDEAIYAQSLAAKILEISTVIIAPIMPFNAENVHQSIKTGLSKAECVFDEPWPTEYMKDVKIQRKVLQDLETIRGLKEQTKQFFDEEKLASKKKNETFNSRKYHISISLHCSKNRPDYQECLDQFLDLLEPLSLDLKNVFECTSVSLINEKVHNYNQNHDELKSPMIFNDKKVNLRIIPSRVKGHQECKRCLQYTKTDPKADFCPECERYVNPQYKKAGM
jgi:isoleucyl-tRNA synthetase